ncbi:hypothetical protein GSI_09728 [Ganoderma sinense ZZ0214-1]|uniref:Uncharacterized protein n=1 Tax=Ganoderma sinense ZZ0214-1 TaxID=1077348 RepID=A0A2G8S360_9APHY|nr:hypothetical protein GSI_09728 [Ganoderma sinense ZZ0214-1]
MPPRSYAMKQGSYWREEEWAFLEKAVHDPEVQEFVTKHENNHARAVLGNMFRAQFTGPSGAEKEEVFRRRVRWTKKARKGLVKRRPAETQEEWELRMTELNDRLGKWLSNWRGRARRGEVSRWSPPILGGPKTRKPRSQTAFDVFCKSDDAPQGSDHLAADGRRCDLNALNAARAAAWTALSVDEQAGFVTAAQGSFEGAAAPDQLVDEELAQEANAGRVATAEDIVDYVDGFVKVMHNDVRWGGLVILGGPDHKGEACMHSQTAGTNRNGQTFLDALLQILGWTQLDFDTVFSLWLEQSREGPLDVEDRTFAEAARRAIEHARAHAASGSGMLSCTNDHNRGTTSIAAEQAKDAAAVIEALNRLTLAIQPGSSSVPQPVDAPQRTDTAMDGTVGHSVPTVTQETVENASPATPGLVFGSTSPVLSCGTAHVGIDSQILSVINANPSLVIGGYEPDCAYIAPFTAPDVPMDWQSAQEPGQDDVDHGDVPTATGNGDPSGDGAVTGQGLRKARARKDAEPSGVAMPGISGLPVVDRVLRPRNSRNREDTMDGHLLSYLSLERYRSLAGAFGETERVRVGHWKYYDPDVQHHVVPIYTHKFIMTRRPGRIDPRVWAFFPEQGKWVVIEKASDLRVPEHARYVIVRFTDIHFLPGFGDALERAEGLYTGMREETWPPEEEATEIVIHGVGTRILRVVFWNRDAAYPLEFALRMAQGDNIEPVLYDALGRRFHYYGEIDIWTVAETTWTKLPKEEPCDILPRYTTVCIKAAEGVGLTPGLGWEITQLERQHVGSTQDVGTDVEGLGSSDDRAI